MDLRDYDRAKFALAEILRAAARRSGEMNQSPSFRDLLFRLAEDRFNLFVVGRFNRGKTSLMNALLGTSVLPVGVLPLTSVVTTVSYGSDVLATIEFKNRSVPDRVPLDRLTKYITEEGNPANVQAVSTARIQLPAALLRHGFHFIDTPGTGSAIVASTQTTLESLPDADVMLLVTSFDSPLSEDEMRLIELGRRYRRRMFVAVNKSDLIDAAERVSILDYVASRLREAGIPDARIFPVSAQSAAGTGRLTHELIRFLIEEKQRDFLRVMCERVRDLLDTLPGTDVEHRNLASLANALGHYHAEEESHWSLEEGRRFFSCTICAHATQAVVSFLSSYQSQLIASDAERAALAKAGGFCEVHSWQYHTLAGPRGACIALSVVLEQNAARLRSFAGEAPEHLSNGVRGLRGGTAECPACRVREAAEETETAAAVRSIKSGSMAPPYCLVHFPYVLAGIDDPEQKIGLLREQALAFERIADDMHRYVLKFDATRRQLMAQEERDADQRGLSMLAGSRGFNGLAVER